jgi:Arc/MetJ-type ribon-helix-helix transcriptional regulator
MPDAAPNADNVAYIDSLVAAGRFASHADALDASIDLMRKREAKRARFDAEMRKAEESLDAGEGIPLDVAFDQLDAHIRKLIQKQAA